MNIKFFCQKKKRTSKSFFVEICFCQWKFQQTIAKPQQRLQQQSTRKKHFCQQKREKCSTIFSKSHFLKQKNNKQDNIERSRKFFFVLNGGKELLHHDKNIDHSIDLLQISTVSEHTLWFGWICRCITHGNVAPRQFSAHRWAAPCAKWATRPTRLRSCLVRNFHLASFRIRFPIRALRSFPHFIISC